MEIESKESILRIPAKLEGMDVVLGFVSYLLDINGAAPKARKQLRMAMEELYVNVALYAYAGGDGWAEIRGAVADGVATFQLIDGGTPFDPLAKPDPDIELSGEERGIGGLGIFMVKNMVNEVTYEYSGGCNRLTLRKKT
ncbi:MAG: ATP-binding protein [Oscillospiraceae bacterium]|nr:ATP-binding protein [Oscillospiraceae bacterium]